jgi:ABC-type antimicrobial peptide transport system permease subunit
MRSALTCAGISIGIAAVIAMVEIGQGSSAVMEQTIARLGANVMQIDPSDAVKAGVSSGAGASVTLTPADADAIGRECAGVRWTAASVDYPAQATYGSRNWAIHKVLGTSPDYLKIRAWAVDEGDAFTDDDVRTVACVCLIGRTPARELFGAAESPVGRFVRVNGVNLKVLGVLARKGAAMFGSDQDDIFIAPLTTVKARLSGIRHGGSTAAAADIAAASAALSSVNSLSGVYPTKSVQRYTPPSPAQKADAPQMVRFTDVDDVFVSAASRGEVPRVIEQVRLLLRERHRLTADQPDDFRIRDLTEIAETAAASGRLLASLLLSVAIISLIVGGVGIMNIMLVSVTERTREIGLRMAVGARGADILWQFLIEAVVLCLAGGAAGIALGRVTSVVITAVLRWPTLPSVTAVMAAVGVSAMVGVLFGFYPAWRASRLDPIEALRYE